MNTVRENSTGSEVFSIGIELSESKTEFSLGVKDRIIIAAHAIFEGIGIAGLISAAFWYTTAPMAPDGFKGPISTFTIAVSTIISLFLAIPIAYLAFKKLVAEMGTLYIELTAEVKGFLHYYNELNYELFKLRSLYLNDLEFKSKLLSKVGNCNNFISSSMLSTLCQKYQLLNTIYFLIQWEQPIQLELCDKETVGSKNSLSILDILKHKDLSTNTAIRTGLIHFFSKHFTANSINFETVVSEAGMYVNKNGRIKNALYGTASGVACTEVLLSIGWTVISVLIGVKSIVPISNMCWAIFVVFCIFVGVLFGIGMAFSRKKQKSIQMLNARLKKRNNDLSCTRELINNFLTEKSFLHSIYRCDDAEVELLI